MTGLIELGRFYDKRDTAFFADHPDRMLHIRKAFVGENEKEFRALGDHNKERRRIVIWRVPENNPAYDPIHRPLLKIPFLAFADETIEDRDDILGPMVDEIMQKASKN